MSQYYSPLGYNSEEQNNELVKKMKVKQQKSEIRLISLLMGCSIIAYLVFQIISVSLITILGLAESYEKSSVFQSSFNIIFISLLSVAIPFGIMSIALKNRYKHPVLPNKPVGALRCFAWVCFGMLCCIAANLVVILTLDFIESLFKIKFTQGELLEPDSPFACLMCVISTAIIPPICEEFAMRCCSLQLLRKYGKGFAVFAVSVVFGILHGNVIQFLFAFIIGLVMGFATVKTDSIIPAVLIHTFNNGISAMSSVVGYCFPNGKGDGMAMNEMVVLACYVLWVVLGIAGFIILCVKKEFKKSEEANEAESKQDDENLLTNAQKIVSFIFPWMIVPLGILGYLTYKSIEM